MSDKGKIKIILHRGSIQIGGICTEISTDNTRLLFDFGAPLEGEGNQELLDIDGVTFGKKNCDGIFLTHYHGDHANEIQRVLADIPVYMHKTAKQILSAQLKHKEIFGEFDWTESFEELDDRQIVKFEDLTVTALHTDHSACASLMYLIEGYEKRILLTGDYRLHGFYKEQLEKTFTELGHIDLMITEGTSLTRKADKYYDEQWAAAQFRKTFEKYKYVFLMAASTNTDRIAAFSRSVPDGKYMITDEYQKQILQIADMEAPLGLKSHKVCYLGNNLLRKMERYGFGMAVRANPRFMPIVKYYFEKHPEKTILIYSMWSGYRDYPNIKQMLDLCTNERTVNVSGHITKEDLEHVIEVVKPQKLIVHHTSAEDNCCYNLDIQDGLLLPSKDGKVICI